MSLPTWLTNLVRAVDTEYDRRIRRASNVDTYAVDSAAHLHSTSDDHSDDLFEEEDEGVEIVNVPRGTRLPAATAVTLQEEETHVS